MIDVDAFRSELEWNLSRRMREIEFLKGLLASLTDDASKSTLRRSVVLVLYSHFEGFCKQVFTSYITVLNGAGLRCRDVIHALAAASLEDVFSALRDPNSKCDLFQRQLPDDAKLHRFARDREFFERFDNAEDRPLRLPDSVVDLESNLKPVVLRKMLFRLGLPHDLFAAVEGRINMLLTFRNNIAHGTQLAGITEGQLALVENATQVVIGEVLRRTTASLAFTQYLR